MADTSDVDATLIAKLSGDATLMALLPGGVGWDLAAVAGATKFLIVSQVDHEEDPVLTSSTLLERITYQVKAVTMGHTSTDVRAAAARIQQLLHYGTITPPDYTCLSIRRTKRVRYTEPHETTDQRWQHRGGYYEVIVCPHHS